MSVVLWLLLVQGSMGAFDTLYYHEFRARLPARPEARPELFLHAARDFVYAAIFALLPHFSFQGAWALVLLGMLLVEILITLTDFVVEDGVRRSQGGVFPGERVMHAVMGIVYGAMLAFLLPEVWAWWAAPTGLVAAVIPGPDWRVPLLGLMAVGVALSGVRDLLSALGVRGAAWPHAVT